MKIYLYPAKIEGEKKHILYNGIIANNNTELTDNINECDYIFLDFRDIIGIRNFECPEKTVIIDFWDNPKVMFDSTCLLYFKRSVVDKWSNTFTKYTREVFPISYCIKNECLNFKITPDNERKTDVSALFRTDKNKGYRKNVAKLVENKFKNYNIHVGLCGQASHYGRGNFQQEYYDKMLDSKIIVTCNPDKWEGDYRLFEALSTGAFILVDKMMTPVKNPFIDGEHLVYYDRKNLPDLERKILYYLKNDEERIRIAKNGYEHAMKYHKASDRIDEILEHLPPKN